MAFLLPFLVGNTVKLLLSRTKEPFFGEMSELGSLSKCV